MGWMARHGFDMNSTLHVLYGDRSGAGRPFFPEALGVLLIAPGGVGVEDAWYRLSMIRPRSPCAGSLIVFPFPLPGENPTELALSSFASKRRGPSKRLRSPLANTEAPSTRVSAGVNGNTAFLPPRTKILQSTPPNHVMRTPVASMRLPRTPFRRYPLLHQMFPIQ